MRRLYERCCLCPRRCGVNRLKGERGLCGESAALRLAAACLHQGEEPPLSGGAGSGAIFVSGCGLCCPFCQNRQISAERAGAEVDAASFAAICLALQKRGAANINIVTGTHAAPALVEGIALARERGLTLPLVWNSSGYETPEIIRLLQDVVAVFLPDLKTLDADFAGRFFKAPDYPEAARAAILTMLDAKPPRYSRGEDGALASGVIIRHLAMPGALAGTKKVMEWFAANARGRALLSLMTQYAPPKNAPAGIPARSLRTAECDTLLRWLTELGIEDGYYQEREEGAAPFPDFYQTQPFPAHLANCVWHWQSGFCA
ncbi:MAG: radical SAM protein [Spirochaetaceae bacterium]|jgi:putative pyruvate formate lyase activating enzyme|nr:radical SAM protein [Spirochaetaceae bacterium]